MGNPRQDWSYLRMEEQRGRRMLGLVMDTLDTFSKELKRENEGEAAKRRSEINARLLKRLEDERLAESESVSSSMEHEWNQKIESAIDSLDSPALEFKITRTAPPIYYKPVNN